MKLEQISYILEIAKQGSIGKAAKKLYMSQPNLSMSIRMLEEELGFKIFDRSNSGVELTAKGMELLQYGEEIERNMDLIRNMNTIAKDEKVNFRISSYYIFFIKHIILELNNRHKNEMLNLIINQDSYSNVIRDVETGLSDIAVIKLTRPVSFTNKRTLMSKNLEFIKVTDGYVCLQVRDGHPLCDIDEAVDVANEIASEHMEIVTKNPFDVMTKVKNAGAIFLGEYSSEPLGDYFAGPNHVLHNSSRP